MVRTPLLDKNGLRKGTWTPEEDRLLKAYIDRYGSWNWRQLPKYAGLSRCGKSCRLRWMNYLRPNIKRGNFSAEEEDTIMKLHNSMGNRWSTIAAELPGRTDNEVKNHWHTKLKKRVQQNSISHEEKNNTNNLAPVEKRRQKLKQQNDSVLEPPTTEVIDTSLMSTLPSSSGVSSISKDSAAATSSIMAMDDSATSAEAYAETGDSFWTQPFLTESSIVPTVFLEPLVVTEYLSPVFDEFFSAYGFAEEKLNSNDLSPREKGQKKLNEPNDSPVNPITTQIVGSSPSSPQPSSSEFSSITRETAAAASTNTIADDNVTSSEAYAETDGNFWTHPFSSDSSYIPTEFLGSFMDTEYLSPVFDEFSVRQMYSW